MTVVNGVRVVSNSEVQSFKNCPREWWLAWYRGLTLKYKSVEGPRGTGTRYHLALAGYYVPEGDAPADPSETLEQVIQEDLAAFNVSFSDAPVDGERLKLLQSQFELERAMIEGYIQWLEETGEDSQLEVVAPEVYVEAEVPDALRLFRMPVKLIGKLDARMRSRLTGTRSFIDHKTVGSLNDPMLGLNQQMLHYHVIEDLLTPVGEPRCDGALYNMARKVKRTRASKPPYFARKPIPHNKFELENYALQLVGVIDKIIQTEHELERGQDHHIAVPSRPSRDCSWRCDFFKICRMFDDGSRVEAAVEYMYEVRDPLHYYGGREKSDV